MIARPNPTPLTTVEQSQLKDYEERIDTGLRHFVATGQALMAIRDQRLYRAKYRTFEEYCKERWELTPQRCNGLVRASAVIKNLETNGSKSYPSCEAQARPLGRLPLEEQAQAWKDATDTAPKGRPTAKHVEEVVRRREAGSSAGRTTKPNPKSTTKPTRPDETNTSLEDELIEDAKKKLRQWRSATIEFFGRRTPPRLLKLVNKVSRAGGI